MGLGLTVAADIIARHDGRIEVESAPGRTAFHILLPIEPEDTP
jgi:nitrogen-specific signal transduction histidine kinase